MEIEVAPGKVEVKIGETVHQLTLAECLTLANALKNIFPAEIRMAHQIQTGQTEFGARQIGPPAGWSPQARMPIQQVIQKGKEDEKDAGAGN